MTLPLPFSPLLEGDVLVSTSGSNVWIVASSSAGDAFVVLIPTLNVQLREPVLWKPTKSLVRVIR